MEIKFREKVLKLLTNNKQIPVIGAVAAGLHPLLFYYNSNFTLVNSWIQLLFFVISFLLIPIVLFFSSNYIFKKINSLNRFRKFLIPILNLICFSVLLVLSTYGFMKSILIIAIGISVILGILLHRHFTKVIVFQFLLAAIAFVMLIPDFYKHLTYSNQWMEQPDDIENVVFNKRPNIYMIQPDGYANFSELNKGHYNFDNSNFEHFLKDNDFKLYDDYRSNYVSTLSSNSSLFAMKHHYYNNTRIKAKELYNARQIIAGDNPTISILKRNNYKTFLLLERSYVLVNRPTMYFDYCNINSKEISFLARGFELHKNVKNDLIQAIDNNNSSNNFYFIGKMDPSHIAIRKNESAGIDGERKIYLEALKKANKWLKEIITLIQEKDKNSLIIIAADHGGYVGLNYSLESKIKQTDRDLIYSIFTSSLAIRWPDKVPHYDYQLKTSVNLFRVLFSFLSEDETYLDHLQDNKSYAIIQEGAPLGVYEYIDETGNTVFKKH